MFKDNPAIQAALEPGDRIVATLRAVERSRQVAALVVSLLLALGWFLAIGLSHANTTVAVVSVIAVGTVNAVLWSRQKSYFIAVTERLFIAHGATWFWGRPTRLLFTAPLPGVGLAVGKRTWYLGISLWYQGPGVPPQGLKLLVGSRSVEFLGSVIAALRKGGASVTQ